MGLYAWVYALLRIAKNAREAALALTEIFGSLEIVLVKLVIFISLILLLFRILGR
jgi:hypothetical protein